MKTDFKTRIHVLRKTGLLDPERPKKIELSPSRRPLLWPYDSLVKILQEVIEIKIHTIRP